MGAVGGPLPDLSRDEDRLDATVRHGDDLCVAAGWVDVFGGLGNGEDGRMDGDGGDQGDQELRHSR